MLNAMRFDAKCNAFWCKMQCKSKGFDHHFFVIADANLAQIFFKEKCKSIVNGKNRREKRAMLAAVFIILLHFI